MSIIDLSQFEITAQLEVIRCQPFEPDCACPRCCTVAHHTAFPPQHGFIARACTTCQFRWRQKEVKRGA